MFKFLLNDWHLFIAGIYVQLEGHCARNMGKILNEYNTYGLPPLRLIRFNCNSKMFDAFEKRAKIHLEKCKNL